MDTDTIKAEPNGVLIVNKPNGPTSHDIVNKIRHIYGTRRVGHTGTLDPMATGVLVVLVGRAAKAAEYITADSKKYRAVLLLGTQTDTEDITGIITGESNNIPDRNTVISQVRKFVGKIMQIPPMYSAIKINGQKLVDLARKGETVERSARETEIFSISCTPTDNIREYILDVHCSGGTYIRTLCADIGKALGCGGCMKALCRSAVGSFGISESYTTDELECMSESEREGVLIPVERLFDSLPAVTLSGFFEKLCRSGCEIYQKKIKTDFPAGQRVRFKTENGLFFAIGEVCEYENGTAIKPIKTFVL